MNRVDPKQVGSRPAIPFREVTELQAISGEMEKGKPVQPPAGIPPASVPQIFRPQPVDPETVLSFPVLPRGLTERATWIELQTMLRRTVEGHTPAQGEESQLGPAAKLLLETVSGYVRTRERIVARVNELSQA